MKNIIRFCVLLFVACFPIISQSQTIRWEENYGGSDADNIRQFFQTTDMGYIAIGYSGSDDEQVDDLLCNPISGENAWVTRLTSSQGQISWKKTIGGLSNDYASDAIEVSNGFIVAGHTHSDECDLVNETPGAWVFKLDQSGNLNWSYTYHPMGFPGEIVELNRIIEKSDGTGFILAGNLRIGNDYTWLFDINEFGIQQSFEVLIPDHEIIDLKPTPDGGFLIGGMEKIFCEDCDCIGGIQDQYVENIWFRKYDSNLSLTWNETYGMDNFNDLLMALYVHDDNTFAAVGSTGQCYLLESPNNTTSTSNILPNGNWAIKFDSLGQINQTYNRHFWVGYFNQYEYGRLMSFKNDHYYFLSTKQDSALERCVNPYAENEFLYYLIKTDSNFNIERYQAFGGTDSEFPYSFNLIEDGGYILAGISESDNGDVSNNFGRYDYWVVETDSFVDPEYCYVNGYTFYPDQPGSLLIHSNRIRRLIFQEIDNSVTPDTGYQDFTHLIATVEPGSTADITIYNVDDVVTPGVIYEGSDYGIWVDWNQDSDFNDTMESYLFPVEYDTMDLFASVTVSSLDIPSFIPLEDTFRMRVGIFPDSVIPAPCNICLFGEYEDYSIFSDLIPNLNCQYQGLGALACNYQHGVATYEDPNNYGSSVQDYDTCAANLTGPEICWELYPGQSHGELTVVLDILDNIDLDLIILDKENEKTGVVACSQTLGNGVDETVTFEIDSNVPYYYVIVDGYSGDTGDYIIRTECNPTEYCISGTTNEEYDILDMSINCVSLPDLCESPFVVQKFPIDPLAMNSIEILLEDNPFYNNGIAPVKTFLRVWIDLNDDGDYLDPNEELLDTFWMNSYMADFDIDFMNIPEGKYSLQYQVATFNHDIDFFDNPCMFWFQGAMLCESKVTIMNESNIPCNSIGCTTCPGSESTYLSQVAFQGSVVASFNDYGYGNYKDQFEIVEQNDNLQVVLDAQACNGENIFYSLFIDFWDGATLGSGNGVFNDLFEQYTNTSGVFDIPLNSIPPGTYPIRIMAESYSGATPNPDPCKINYPGETEDYTLIICPTNDTCAQPPLNNFIGRPNRGLAVLNVNFRPDYSMFHFNSEFIDTTTYNYKWFFPGGNPSSSTSKTPIIEYDESGFYPVTLITTNSVGSDTLTKLDYVEVYSDQNNCPDSINIFGTIIPNGVYTANIQINSSGIVPASGNVTFSAPNVNLLDSFTVENGGLFEVNQDDCPD